MTVTLIADDLIYPVGELQPAHFPDGDLSANLGVWLAEAVTNVASIADSEDDEAARHWVYYRAYSAIARRIAALPSSYSDSGSNMGTRTTNWGQNRADYWQKLADEELAEYNAIVETVSKNTAIAAFGLVRGRRGR